MIHGYTRMVRGTPLLVQAYIIHILIVYSILRLFRLLECRYLTPPAMS